jgi:L-ascorbate metabolism protein UlaG (beta-lactamase superfamily)
LSPGIRYNASGAQEKPFRQPTGEDPVNNPDLKNIDTDFPGMRFENGQFQGDYTSRTGKSFWPILKWRLSANPKADAKKKDTFRLKVTPLDQLPPALSGQNYMIWLGHASFLIHAHGKNIVTDPCLTAPPFFKRLAEVPLDIRKVPLDYLLISHGHYDHLDSDTVKRLTGTNLQALVPMGIGRFTWEWNPAIRVQEAGWFQQYQTHDGLELFFLPARHWNKRGLFDLNTSLWGSFLIRCQGKTIYFAGDTAYDSHFREIRRLFGPIDIALLPIGAYDPPFIMRDSHMNPSQALQAFKDLEARILIPMHYGTFDLTDEPLGEPLEWLQREAAETGVQSKIKPLSVGETMTW